MTGRVVFIRIAQADHAGWRTAPGDTVALAGRGWLETGWVNAASGASSVFAGFRFPREVISVAVRWYLQYGLSYRDVEECLPNAVSLLITSPSTGGWNVSPRSLSRLPGRAGHAPGDR